MTDEHREIEEKIQREKRYFMEKMSIEDCQRLEGLENLYGEAAHHEEIEIYTHGFTLGALMMLEVMESKQAIINK